MPIVYVTKDKSTVDSLYGEYVEIASLNESKVPKVSVDAVHKDCVFWLI